MKHFVLFIICHLLIGCGLKITNIIDENLLSGDWELDEIRCYLPNQALFTERYVIGSDPKVTMTFNSDTFQYTVSSNTCTTTAYGNYVTEFDGNFSDQMDFINVISGSTCDINLSFQGQVSGGTSDVDFALLPNNARNLIWEVGELRDEMSLDLYTGFTGSDDGAFCGGACECEAIFERPAS